MQGHFALIHNPLIFGKFNFFHSPLKTIFRVAIEICLKSFEIKKRIVVRLDEVILVFGQLVLNPFVFALQFCLFFVHVVLSFLKILNFGWLKIFETFNFSNFFPEFGFLSGTGLVFKKVRFDVFHARGVQMARVKNLLLLC